MITSFLSYRSDPPLQRNPKPKTPSKSPQKNPQANNLNQNWTTTKKPNKNQQNNMFYLSVTKTCRIEQMKFLLQQRI